MYLLRPTAHLPALYLRLSEGEAMTLDEAVFIVNRMAQVLSDSALILDKMDAQAGEPDDYRLTARARRQEAEALRVVIAHTTTRRKGR
jgi:hypothetical protein